MAEGKEPRSSKRMTDLIGQVLRMNKLISLQKIPHYVCPKLATDGKSSKLFCAFVHLMLLALSYSVNTCTIMIPISPSALANLRNRLVSK